MSRSIRRIRSNLALGFSVCAALTLASCGESPLVEPQKEGYSPRVPLASLSTEFDSYQFLGFVLDDAGANDTPAQSDLNAFTRADNVSGKIGVKWVWDDINSWTGSGQTGDACALFDTDNDGKANAAVCVRITNPNGDPNVVAQLAAPASPLVYSCGDNKTDRCASPTRLASSTGGTICEVEKIDGENFFAAGDDGADVLAACSIPLAAISASSSPNLINVCSFPSGSPNSNPFDCVVTPGAGFLVIKKATTPQSSGLTFSFTVNPAPVAGANQSVADTTANVEQTVLLSALPGTNYRVKEVSIPADWHLNSASCARQTSPTPTATGTPVGDSVSGISITSGETTVCTFTNSRNQGTIELKKVWVGGGGQTTLNIGTTAAGSETVSQQTGASGAAPLTTSAQTVNTGTYYVSETGGLDDYGSQLACTNKGNAISVGASNSVSVATGDVVVCTFTNTRNQGSIELKKVWSGTPGQTTLKIGTSAAGSETASQLTGAAGAAPLSTGAQSVNTGTYYVSETGGLTDYSSQLACTNKGNAISVGLNNSITLATGDVVVCTFTNTRNQGSIELAKMWSGSPGQTTLNIGTSAAGSQTASQLTGAAGAAPLTTGAQTVNTGTYYLSESGGLTDYTPQLACTNNGNPTSVGAGNSISVAKSDVVVCTFTNTRNQGSIELKKVWVGVAGQTTLNIGTSAGGSQTASQLTGASGAAPLSTGAQAVNTGTYYVSETGGLTDYSSQLACTNKGNAITPGANNSVSVASGDVIVCTFTNTRNQGSIELKKAWTGTAGQTTLNIGTSAAGSQTASQLTGAAGAAPLSTGAQSVNTGTYYVSETGGLTDYSSQLACTNKGNAITPGANNSVSVATGDVVVCTFTNTRNQGSIELKKVWVGTAGQTTLNIGTSAAGSQTASQLTGASGAAPLSTGAQSVNTGTYYVSETGGLTNYSSQLACTNKGNSITPGANNSVSVATGDVVVCTFTNTRNQGSIELKKVWSGTPGQTTLNIGTSSGGSQTASQLTGAAGAAPLSTGAQSVNTGTYYVSETGGLTNYSSQLACTNKGNSITPGANNSVSVATGDVVVCTFTNTRNQGSIELKKVWSGTPGQTTLNIGTSSGGSQTASQLTGAAGAAPLSTGAQSVNTGTYFVSETGGLTNYSSQLTCTNNGNSITPGANNSVPVATGDVVVCTFTNTRNQGSIELKKVWVGQAGQTTLNIGTSAGGSQVASQLTGAAGAAPLSTGSQSVNTGTYFVSETGGLAAHSPQLACTNNGSSITPGANNSVTVATEAVVICTFTNTAVPPSIAVVKTASPDSIPETGGNVTYNVVVTNNATFPVTLTSLVDSVFGNLNGVGTCNSPSSPTNPYGVIAPSGTYTCSFQKTLAASNAGQTHINKVTASVTSDGGPASASDTARVRYTDVKPNISVTKSADTNIITATGGLSVAGFGPDTTFTATGGGGGGGGVTPIYASQICDDAGANDTPAQSDLDCFTRADNVNGYLYLKLTWDDINSWTGSGQTGDACALIDTDNSGFANFSFCVRITNPGGDPTVIAQVAGSPLLYACKDKEADRCSSPITPKTLDATSTCTISLVPEHFANGDDGQDVQAECKLKLTDLAQNASIQNLDLLNVCSFPSGSPGSNPFDCVVTPAAGFLIIAEATNPSTSTAVFGFRLRNSANTLNATATNGFDEFGVQAQATSPGIPILPGTYALKQLMPSSWNLDSISCTRDGNTIGTTSGDTRLDITIVQGQTTTCTFNNSLSASQSVEFTVVVTNNSLEAVSLFSLEDSENPGAATPTYVSLNEVGTCATGGSIAGGGGTYTCTFSRTISGTPGTSHSDKVRAVGKDNENNSDTKTSSTVTVTIN